MAKIPHRSIEDVQRALLRFGDAAFRICYMHTKSPKNTRALLEDVFTQYFLRTKPFKSEDAERLWVMRTTHLVCMDYYAAKLRRKPAAEQVREAARNEDFQISDELYTILTLPYTQLTALALVCGEGETEAFAAKVIGRSAKQVTKQLDAAAKKAGLSPEDLTEWIGTITFSEDMRYRVLHAIRTAAGDKHFTVNAYAAKLKRSVDRSLPYTALVLVLFCVFCVYVVRSGMFGYEYIRFGAGGNAVIELDDDTSRVTNEALNAADSDQPGITLDLYYFVPEGEDLIRYNCTMEADAILLTQKMAEKGVFPEDVVLQGVLLIQNGKVVETLRSGDHVEARLLYPESLQAALDAHENPEAALEAVARSIYGFYDTAHLTLASLEIYAGDAPVTIGGEAVNCTALLHGTRKVLEIRLDQEG